jgi:hypothetical protein
LSFQSLYYFVIGEAFEILKFGTGKLSFGLYCPGPGTPLSITGTDLSSGYLGSISPLSTLLKV